MADLSEVVTRRDGDESLSFRCAAVVGGELLAAVPTMSEDEILAEAAWAVQYETGMAEIHTGHAAGIDVVELGVGPFPQVKAKVWMDRTPEPLVVVWPA